MALSGSPVWQSCLELDHLKGWGLDEPSLGLLTVVKIISGNSEDFSRFFFFFLFRRIYFFPRRPPWDIPREYLKTLLRRSARSAVLGPFGGESAASSRGREEALAPGAVSLRVSPRSHPRQPGRNAGAEELLTLPRCADRETEAQRGRHVAPRDL